MAFLQWLFSILPDVVAHIYLFSYHGWLKFEALIFENLKFNHIDLVSAEDAIYYLFIYPRGSRALQRAVACGNTKMIQV